MLERYFLQPATVDRIRASWLAEPIEKYVAWLTERGYQPRCIFGRVPLLVRFGSFTHARGATRWEDLPSHIDAFVAEQLRQRKRQCRNEAARKIFAYDQQHPIRQMLRLILPDACKGSRERHAQGPLNNWKPGFIAYLREERGLSEATIPLYENHLRRLEKFLCQAKLKDLTGLSPDLLDRFIATSSKSLSRASLPALCSFLRLLLRYLYRQQAIARNLSPLIEAPKNYRSSTIPRSISREDVQRTLESVDRRSAIGKRDYAILMLLVTYGLRAREVAALTLDDIDWRSEKLAVRMRKAGHSTVYPLSPATGEALLDYIKHGRPETAERCVFLRSRAPRIPISHRIVSIQATRYLRKAGVKIARAGSHTLRHSCAQRLIDADFSLKVIGDYLGHRSTSSTEIYSKVAIEALREVALGDGEEIL